MTNIQIHRNGRYKQLVWRNSKGDKLTLSIGSVSEDGARLERDKLAALFATNPALIDTYNDSTTLRDWQKRFFESRDIAGGTMKLYVATFGRLRQHFGDIAIKAIDRAGAQDFLNALNAPEANLSSSTIYMHLARTRAIMQAAADVDLIAFNPFDRLKQKPPKCTPVFRYVPADEITRLVQAAAHDVGMALMIARYAGLRINEIQRLEWRDIDLATKILTVRHEGAATTKKGARIIPLCPELAQYFADKRFARETDSPRVVLMNWDSIYRSLEKLQEETKVEPWGQPMHGLRKSCEQDWLMKYDVPNVAKMMGHSPQIALKLYHKLDGRVIKSIIEGQ